MCVSSDYTCSLLSYGRNGPRRDDRCGWGSKRRYFPLRHTLLFYSKIIIVENDCYSSCSWIRIGGCSCDQIAL